jgi:hypothetical protein
MVKRPEDYQYSSHRAYLGIEPTGMVDVDPVLRHFGARKEIARERYRQFVAAGVKHGHRDEFYASSEEQILGNDEFIDATIHQIGESRRATRDSKGNPTATSEFQPDRLIAAVERFCRISKGEFCGRGKSRPAVKARELLILIGLQAGATRKTLCEITGISISALGRRVDAARMKLEEDVEARNVAEEITKEYWGGVSQESQA